jgi:hypothetical protein
MREGPQALRGAYRVCEGGTQMMIGANRVEKQTKMKTDENDIVGFIGAYTIMMRLHHPIRTICRVPLSSHTCRALSTSPKDDSLVVVLYTSPRPALILNAARLLAVKSAASAIGAVWATTVALGGSNSIGVASVAALPALTVSAPVIPQAASVVMGLLSGAGVSGSFALAGAFAVLSFASGYAARVISRSILVRLETPREVEDTSNAVQMMISAYTPSLFGAGNNITVFKRSDVLGSTATSTIQSFRVKIGGNGDGDSGDRGGEIRTFALFPVEPHWRSDDINALRALVYENYFRKEEEPGGNTPRVAISARELASEIEGFGPFRPAIFADPLAVTARAENALLPNVVYEAHGTVWAKFNTPAPLNEAALRRADRRKGEGLSNDTPLPTVPSILNALPLLTNNLLVQNGGLDKGTKT